MIKKTVMEKWNKEDSAELYHIGNWESEYFEISANKGFPCLSFLASELSETDPDEALFHVMPVPYEKTITYGTRTGKEPSAIFTASQQLELFDGVGIPLSSRWPD